MIILRLTMGLMLLALCAACGRAGGEAFQPTQSTVVAVPEGGTVGQTINPTGSTVVGVDLQVATYAEPADPDGQMTVTMIDPASGRQLGRAIVAGQALSDLAWIPATFPDPIVVADDQALLVEVGWDGDTNLALLANAPLEPTRPRSARELGNNPYPDGTLVVDGRAQTGDLAFRIRGPGGSSQAAAQIREVLASTGSRMVQQPLFTLFWLLALAAAGVLVRVGFRRPL